MPRGFNRYRRLSVCSGIIYTPDSPGKNLEKLEETQKVVEEVVNVAIENEMEEDEIEELVIGLWSGNDPRGFYLEEAEG